MKNRLLSLLTVGAIMTTSSWLFSQPAYASCSCPAGYTLTGDLNLNLNPNCISDEVIATPAIVNGTAQCAGTSSAACVQILSCGCDTSTNFDCDVTNTGLNYRQITGFPQEPYFQCQDIFGDINNDHNIRYYDINRPNVEATCSGPINGQCGLANGSSSDIAPTTNLCTSGTPSTVVDNGGLSRDWTCQGNNGGLDELCSALVTTVGVDPVDPPIGCITEEEDPVLCDLLDPLMAGVCYIPSGSEVTLMVTDGKVGINNLAPESALDVYGVMRGVQTITLSDERLKSSIEKIDNSLEKIRAINGYSFTWKDSGEPDLGVLAQEIEKVFADAVHTDTNGRKTVQYNALLAPVIEAIHELNAQIDSLYNEKFENQVKRIEAIEKAVK